jgi:hypothetical protein
MPRPLGTPDEKRADRIAHLNALRGLIANREALEESSCAILAGPEHNESRNVATFAVEWM